MSPEQTARWLLAHDGYLILPHRRPDGDTIGSAAALCDGLRQAGKTAYILDNPEITDNYRPFADPFWAPADFVPETVVSVDLASFSLFPDTALAYEHAVALAIDHHPSNTLYAENVCLDGACAACGEILYEILMTMNGSLSQTACDALYVAIASDSGCFAFANTTANTLRVASLLVAAGADNRGINRKYFRTKTRGRILIEGMIYSGIEFYYAGRVSIITITNEMMTKAAVTENDMDDIAAIPGSVEGALVGITVKELKNGGGSKISVRTGPEVDSNALCAKFGGGGHAMASGCTIALPVEQAKAALLAALGENFPGIDP